MENKVWLSTLEKLSFVWSLCIWRVSELIILFSKPDINFEKKNTSGHAHDLLK